MQRSDAASNKSQSASEWKSTLIDNYQKRVGKAEKYELIVILSDDSAEDQLTTIEIVKVCRPMRVSTQGHAPLPRFRCETLRVSLASEDLA